MCVCAVCMLVFLAFVSCPGLGVFRLAKCVRVVCMRARVLLAFPAPSFANGERSWPKQAVNIWWGGR